jgi:putative oligomerization/nucleic acid binding protein
MTLARHRGLRLERPTPRQLSIFRRYTPWWAILLAIGLFPIRLVALCFKSTETLTVLGFEETTGARFTTSGFSSRDVNETPNQAMSAHWRSTKSPLEEIDRLAALRSSGALTEEEFQVEKTRLLGG